jgi:hypothetical protein
MANKSGYYKYLRDQKLKESTRRQFPEIYNSKIKRAKIIMTIAAIAACCAFMAIILLLFFN